MLGRALKGASLPVLAKSGCLHLMARSQWRSDRLIILCYHGVSQKDEHKWRPGLYISQRTFRSRMQILRDGNYNVLPLEDAVWRLTSKNLPQRSVVITFDDGFHDFHDVALPVLREFGFPVTVYLTTYYAGHNVPLFNLVIAYLLWRARGAYVGPIRGVCESGLDLSTPESTRIACRGIVDFAERRDLSSNDKDDLAALVAQSIGVDYTEIKKARLLQIMDHAEIAQVSNSGVDVQLHTHRHRTPHDHTLFVREIIENRQQIRDITGHKAVHFCYPSGRYAPEFLPWLRECGVESATTCNVALADERTSPLLLPRLLDSENITHADFESWTSGFRSLIAKRCKWNQSCREIT